MEIIKQSFLNHCHKKVFVILCLHEDEPFLEGDYCVALRNILIRLRFPFSLFEEGSCCHSQPHTDSGS